MYHLASTSDSARDIRSHVRQQASRKREQSHSPMYVHEKEVGRVHVNRYNHHAKESDDCSSNEDEPSTTTTVNDARDATALPSLMGTPTYHHHAVWPAELPLLFDPLGHAFGGVEDDAMDADDDKADENVGGMGLPTNSGG